LSGKFPFFLSLPFFEQEIAVVLFIKTKPFVKDTYKVKLMVKNILRAKESHGFGRRFS
jgi:hypothetical protein